MGKLNKNRDKLFFFWSQEFLPRRYPSSLQRRTFPTAQQRRGDFSQTFDTNRTLIPIWDPLNNRVPFAGNIIPTSRIDRNGQALLNVFPQPNAVDRVEITVAGRLSYQDFMRIMDTCSRQKLAGGKPLQNVNFKVK